MQPGAFSINLAVKDLLASRDFHTELGFEVAGGDAEQNSRILRNGDHVIGHFPGMFERNMLTFNPGWAQQCDETAPYTDVRAVQDELKQAGLTLASEADATTRGPASLIVIDPDGNPVLIDQHR